MRLAFGLILLASLAPGQTISLEKERVLGARLAADYQEQFGRVAAPAAQTFLENRGARLVSALPSEGPALSYTFLLVGGRTTSSREPIVLPGGFVLVPVALFVNAQTEEEFTGLLAHALIHASKRHMIKQAEPGQRADLGSIPLLFAGGWTGDDTLLPLAFRELRRAAEEEASRLGPALLASAGLPVDSSEYAGVREQLAQIVGVGRPKPPSLHRSRGR